MRIVSWNIRHGGGRRIERIAQQLRRWDTDCVVLGEFRATAPSQALAERLADLGLGYQVGSTIPDQPGTNALLVASRFPLAERPASGFEDGHRWLPVEVQSARPFRLIGMHVPNRSSGRKYDFHDAVVRELETLRDHLAVAVGDTNTGRQGIDEENPFFNDREDGWFDQLAAVGWHDAFRVENPQKRVYTWRSTHGNGFRLDQAFLTESAMTALGDIRYDWGGPTPPSDHAAVILDLQLER